MFFIAELRRKLVLFVCWKAKLPKKKLLSTRFNLFLKTEICNTDKFYSIIKKKKKKKSETFFIYLIQMLTKTEEGKRT